MVENSSLAWLLKYPHLTPGDFCLFGYWKFNVNGFSPSNFSELIDMIRRDVPCESCEHPNLLNSVVFGFMNHLKHIPYTGGHAVATHTTATNDLGSICLSFAYLFFDFYTIVPPIDCVLSFFPLS